MSLVKLLDIQNSTVFLETCNKYSENEVKKIISFIIISKRIKYFWIHLTKEVQGLDLENYEILLKEIKEDLNKWGHLMFMDQKI